MTMAPSAESDFVPSVAKYDDQTSSTLWNVPDLFSGKSSVPALENRSPVNGDNVFTPDNQSNRILNGFLVENNGADKTGFNSTDKTSKGADRGEQAQSFGDKLSGIISKIGDFLQKIVPPEYAQYVQQYLPMAEQFISQLLNDVKTSSGQNGAQHLEADLKEPHTVPDVLPGSNLEVGQKVGFDMKWGENGPELNNITGLKLTGDTNGKIRGGRVDIGEGEPTLYATVEGDDGQTNEVPIPLPDVSSFLGM